MYSTVTTVTDTTVTDTVLHIWEVAQRVDQEKKIVTIW